MGRHGFFAQAVTNLTNQATITDVLNLTNAGDPQAGSHPARSYRGVTP